MKEPPLTYSSHLAGLLREQRKEHFLDTGPVHIKVATSLTDDTSKSINLMNTIGHNERPLGSKNRNNTNCYWLPSEVNKNEPVFRRAKIHPMFVLACAKAGSKINAEYHPKFENIYFKCIRGKLHRGEGNKRANDKHALKIQRKSSGLSEGPHKKKSQRRIQMPQRRQENKCRVHWGDSSDEDSLEEKQPLEEDLLNSTTCKFKFCVYWCPDCQQWFLPHKQSGSIKYCGHRRVASNLMRLHTNIVLSVFEAGTSEGDNQNAKPRANPAGFGHDQQISVSSKYTVLS